MVQLISRNIKNRNNKDSYKSDDLPTILVKIRARKLLSWREMSEEIGIARTTLIRFVAGLHKPLFTTLVRLNNYIEDNVEHLLPRVKQIPGQQEIK